MTPLLGKERSGVIGKDNIKMMYLFSDGVGFITNCGINLLEHNKKDVRFILINHICFANNNSSNC